MPCVRIRRRGKARTSGQAVSPRAQGIGGADVAQLAHQRWQVRVVGALFLAVEHGLVETGAHQCITETGDVDERADMRHLVRLRERIAQFPQGFRAERRDQQQAMRLQHASETGEHHIEIVHPLQAQVGEQHIHRCIGQRQRACVTADLARHLHEGVEAL